MEIQKFENMSCLRCISVVSGLLQLWAVPYLLWVALGCSGLPWVSSGLFLPRFGLLLDLLVAFGAPRSFPGFLGASYSNLGDILARLVSILGLS